MRSTTMVRGLLAVAMAGLLFGWTSPSQGQDKQPMGGVKVPMNGKAGPMNGKVPMNGKAGSNGKAKAKKSDGKAKADGAAAEHGDEGDAGAGPNPASMIPTLDYNYYHPGPNSGGSQIPAQLYLCPLSWPPPYVGYTYITYPPFQPHEWLWIHRRAYYRTHPGGGATMTSIWWTHE